jgi:hypothetical protein
LTFTDSVFSVWGKTGAILYRTTDEFSGPITLLRSQVDVSSPAVAEGFDGEGFVGLQVIESHINAHGGTAGSGVHWDSGPVLVDNSTIDATTSALGVDTAVFGSSTPVKVTVLRSQLHGSVGGLGLRHAAAHVESSVISGPTSVNISEDGSLTASTSQLAGTVTKEPGGTASCDHVYDGNLVLRPATCVSP